MRFDLMGAKLSIANIEKITQAEEAYEQTQTLLKSTALKPIIRWSGKRVLTKDDPIKNGALLVKMLAFIRQFCLVTLYLDLLEQNVLSVEPDTYSYIAAKNIYQPNDPDLSSELVQGCSELGWVALAPTIKQYIDKYFSSQAAAITHSLAFSLIPNNDQERQIRSDLLGNVFNRNIHWKCYSDDNSSWPILIEAFHYHDCHSIIAQNIRFLQLNPHSPFHHLMKVLPIINATITTCQSCDTFEALIMPWLISLIKRTIDVFNFRLSMRRPAASCGCQDCKKVEEFVLNPTVKKQKFIVSCENWQKNIHGCARIKEENPVPWGTYRATKEKTIILTKKSSAIREFEESLQVINYLQSLLAIE